jgi:hypothetical protein
VNSNGADARLFGIGTTLTPSSFMTGLSNQNKPWDPKAAVNIPWYRTPSGFMRQNIFMDIASNINRYPRQAVGLFGAAFLRSFAIGCLVACVMQSRLLVGMQTNYVMTRGILWFERKC